MSAGRGKLSKREIVSYGVADMGFTLSYTTVTMFLLYFYTDVLGISAAAAGTIMLATRFWDAVNDPLMGYVADHTKSRWGRFRPYLLFGAFPLVAATILCFMAFELSPVGKIIYAVVTFTLYTMAYTATNIPYSALTSVMTGDYHERAALSTVRMFFSGAGSSVTGILTIPLVGMFAGERFGFAAVNLIYSGAVIALLLITFTGVRERLDVAAKSSYRPKEALRALSGNGPLLVLALVFFCSFIATTMRNSANIYFLKYYLERVDLIPVFAGAATLTGLSAMLLITGLIKRYGKNKVLIAGSACTFFCLMPIYIVPAENIPLLLALSSAATFFSVAPMVCTWAIIPDVVDYGEWKTGFRADGIINSVFSFCLKAAMALSLFIAGWVMTTGGYEAHADQAPAALQAILHTAVGLPAFSFLAMTLIMLFFFKLDAEKSAEITGTISGARLSTGT